MNQEHSNALPFGTTIDSYQIKDVLGVGGFGVTYRAYDYTLDQTVAIKEYLPDGLAYRVPDSQALTHRSQGDIETYQYGLTRFLDEARTLAKFRDPSIVRVIRFIEANGTAYLVMDYEHGDVLAHRLRRGTLPDNQIRQLLVRLLHGLSAVHAQEFLHRDIKPANILLRTEGVPVLLDFGAARQALGEQTKMLTAMVTPGYAPFEQYHSKDAQGPWSDLYGLGATLYHCMTGRAPAAATERVAALYDGSADPTEKRLETVEDKYSGELIELVGWLLKPHAKDRPQSTSDVLGHVQPLDFDVGDQNEPARAARPPAGGERPDPDSEIEPEILKTVHVSLEEQIGPMAAALVRKAGRQVSNVEELTELLARFIPSEEQKTQFLGRTRMIRPGQVEDLADRLQAARPREAKPQQQAPRQRRPRAERAKAQPAPAKVRPAESPKARPARQPEARRSAERPKVRPAPPPEKRPAQPAASPPPDQAAREDPPAAASISEHLIQVAKEQLVVYVGPIAGMLVRKSAKRASSSDDFVRRLSEELTDSRQRAAFLQSMKAVQTGGG